MWQNHPSAIRKSSQESGDLDWNPIANTIGNIESIIGQGNPVATRGTKYSSRRFLTNHSWNACICSGHVPESGTVKNHAASFYWKHVNFARFCQSAPLTRSTMKISSNERVIKQPLVLGWTIEWSSVANSSRFSLCFATRVSFSFRIFRSIISILDERMRRRRWKSED